MSAPLPLSVDTTCPFCGTAVVVRLLSARTTAQVTNVSFTAEYTTHHRCPDQADPWQGAPSADTSWAVPTPDPS